MKKDTEVNHNILNVDKTQSEVAKDSSIPAEYKQGSNAYVDDVQDLKCRICEKTFTRKYSLHNHYRVHSNQKPYQCKICDKGFTQKHRYSH